LLLILQRNFNLAFAEKNQRTFSNNSDSPHLALVEVDRVPTVVGALQEAGAASTIFSQIS
jgi:hypothetical protein